MTIPYEEGIMEFAHPQTVSGNTGIVGIGEWLVTLILTAIPIVGIVMLFVWAFGSDTKPSKANWAKATLVFVAIAVVFYILVIVVIIGGMSALSTQF